MPSEEVPLKVSVEKPSLPTLWLDTWVVRRLAEEVDRRGDPAERKRLGHLQDLVFERVKAGRLLCPEADQREEYAPTEAGRDTASKWALLSRGTRLRHRSDIERFELFYAAEAMRAHAEELHLPLRVYFEKDPVAELNRSRRDWYVVSAFTAPRQAETDRMVAGKQRSADDLETLRERVVAEGTSFEGQLLKEARGTLEAFEARLKQGLEQHEKVRRFGIPKPSPEVLVSHPKFSELIRRELEVDEHCDPVERVRLLLGSTYYRATPGEVIRTTLYADLLTGRSPVTASDPADIDFLAAAIPASHFVLADKAMAARIRKFRLDEKWGAQVFSGQSLDQLIAKVEAI